MTSTFRCPLRSEAIILKERGGRVLFNTTQGGTTVLPPSRTRVYLLGTLNRQPASRSGYALTRTSRYVVATIFNDEIHSLQKSSPRLFVYHVASFPLHSVPPKPKRGLPYWPWKDNEPSRQMAEVSHIYITIYYDFRLKLPIFLSLPIPSATRSLSPSLSSSTTSWQWMSPSLPPFPVSG